jgi:alpha-galactosidase
MHYIAFFKLLFINFFFLFQYIFIMKHVILLCLLWLFLMLQTKAQHTFSNVANTNTPKHEKTQRTNNTQKKIVASKPPMGWNSWVNFGCDITEEEFKQQVDYTATNLLQYGYQYMTIDISWFSPNVSADLRSPYWHTRFAKHDAVIDKYGRFLPAVNKFPSAKNGSFKALADYVHGKGLKFGLHIMRGIPWQAVEKDLPIAGTNFKAKDIANAADVCEWYNATYGIDMSKPGAQEYYNSLFALYALWGVDFIKVDDLSMPYHADEIAAVKKAIEKCGRQMVFSTSPGSTPITARYHVLTNADMFRVSADFWDAWPRLKEQFNLADLWAVHAVNFPGHWPDLDLIPVGKIATRSGDAGGERWTRFTIAEQYSMMTLWCVARSPLIIGNDLTQNDPFTLQLLNNSEIIEVNQYGQNQKQVYNSNGVIIWQSACRDNKSYNVALFNLNDTDTSFNLKFELMRLKGKQLFRDLWAKKDSGVFETELSVAIPKHGAVLYKITPVK